MLALIPLKDWIYAGIIAALLVGFGVFVHHERTVGAAHEVAALQKSSAELTQKAEAHIAAVTKTYADETAKTVGTLNAQLQTVSNQHVSDTQRLREYDAYRRQRANVASTGSAGGTQNQGTSVANADFDSVSRLEQVGSELADAARVSAATLGACMADRDALTGKP